MDIFGWKAKARLRALNADLQAIVITGVREGRDIMGPMTLDQFRLMVKYGTYGEQRMAHMFGNEHPAQPWDIKVEYREKR